MPASAVDIVRPVFQHTIQELFKPFRLAQWIRLAFVGLLAGELSGAGGCSLQIPWRPRGGNGSENFLAQGIAYPGMLVVAATALLIGLFIVLLVALIYVSSRMRFVLFDSVVAKECQIRRFWAARGEPGFRYFLFQLLFALVMVGGLGVLGGTGVAIAFGFGWFRNPGQHLLPLILLGIVFFFLFAGFVIFAVVVKVLIKDFVVPQMALENIGVGEGWRRLWSMMSTEKAGYAGYVGMKIVLSIAGAVAMGIAALIVVLVFLIPSAAVALIAVFGGRAIGLAWNPYTTSLAIVAGGIVLAMVVFCVLLASVPTIVFFPAYSIYFFAARYATLGAVLYPPAPPNPASP